MNVNFDVISIGALHRISTIACPGLTSPRYRGYDSVFGSRGPTAS
jgi:hypothetical protein